MTDGFIPMSLLSIPHVKVSFGLTPDAIEAYLLMNGDLGKPWEDDRREQLNLLASDPTHMPVVLRGMFTNEVLAVCTAIFVSRSFYEECSTANEPWIMARASMWARRGKRPFLDTTEIRRDNSGEGLHLMIANYTVFSDDPVARNSLYSELLFTFLKKYRGYRLSCFFAEPATDAYVEGLLAHGFVTVNSYDRHRRTDGRAPVLMAIDRQRALLGHNHFVCRLFDYRVPVARLSPASQELLNEAILGGTDSELASALGCTVDAIKCRWARVYDALDEHLPGYLPNPSFGGRGREKRRMAIEFARQNPWELRPYEWRYLEGLEAIVAPKIGR